MSKKRKRCQDHTASMEYNLPTPKTSGRTSRATSLKPNENEFRELLNNAFKSRLSSFIQAHLKQGGSKSKNDNVKDVEQKRRKYLQVLLKHLTINAVLIGLLIPVSV
ncbi:hypothetical protein G6F56_014029 [Rhizopus delemar]|nr:hypothetical protein G6F56_014029 [Rhizopus delemar]